jgi:hypothetical protein
VPPALSLSRSRRARNSSKLGPCPRRGACLDSARPIATVTSAAAARESHPKDRNKIFACVAHFPRSSPLFVSLVRILSDRDDFIFVQGAFDGVEGKSVTLGIR